MNEIVVLSGKGGTGKTSIAASLAVLAKSEAIIADCDVDAANMHLLLAPDFKVQEDFYGGKTAKINTETCIQCGKCEAVCRFDAISHDTSFTFKVNHVECEGCGYCEKICPSKAIELLEQKTGTIFTSKIKTVTTMVHARLAIGAENSGKLVASVKNAAHSLAQNENKHFIIADGSPGIGCPVVSSLAGANFVLLVTEPTMSGLHDLKRIHSVIKRFRIPCGCIINKYDLNQYKTLEIKNFLKDENIIHLADIPFDMVFSNSLSEGKTVVEMDSPIKHKIEDIWNKLKKNND